MAADTATRRLSAMNLGSPWRGVGILPGSDPAEIRPAVMFLYAGLAVLPTGELPGVAVFRAPRRPGVLRMPEREPAFVGANRLPSFIADPRNERQ